MSRRESIVVVLLATAELLSRPDTSSVSDAEVLRELGWPSERADEIRGLMAQLVEEGDLRGPLRGPLRGDNQILDVDVLGVTRQGRQRLAPAMLPWWRRRGSPAAIAIWGITAATVAGVLVAVLSGYARRRLGLP